VPVREIGGSFSSSVKTPVWHVCTQVFCCVMVTPVSFSPKDEAAHPSREWCLSVKVHVVCVLSYTGRGVLDRIILFGFECWYGIMEEGAPLCDIVRHLLQIQNNENTKYTMYVQMRNLLLAGPITAM